MKTEISEYEQKAIDFLTLTQTEFICTFLRYGKHFSDDKESRDIYVITIKRGSRSFTFNFGQSIVSSGEYKLLDSGLIKQFGRSRISKTEYKKLLFHDKRGAIKNSKFCAPSAYDVLACITKSDPVSLEIFCEDFGYNPDSKKAEKTYNAVLDEWNNVKILYSDYEIEMLQEIN